MLVGLDGLEDVLTDGDVLLHEHILPNSVHGQVLGLVHEHEAGGEVAPYLGLIGEVHRLQQGRQHGLGGGAETDGSAGHAVDGCIEEVQTHGHVAVEVTHEHFVHDGHEVIVLDEDVVGVPMDAVGDVEHEVADKGTVGRELVGDVLGGVEVTRIESDTAVMIRIARKCADHLCQKTSIREQSGESPDPRSPMHPLPQGALCHLHPSA